MLKLFGWVSQDQNYKNLIAKQLNPRGSHQHMKNDGCRMNMQARVQDLSIKNSLFVISFHWIIY